MFSKLIKERVDVEQKRIIKTYENQQLEYEDLMVSPGAWDRVKALAYHRCASSLTL